MGTPRPAFTIADYITAITGDVHEPADERHVSSNVDYLAPTTDMLQQVLDALRKL